MQKRRNFKTSQSLERRLGEEAAELRQQASELPEGLRRDHVLRKARQCETGAHITDWMNSRGLQPPN
ncbi:hypothetical protein ACVWZ4_004360 [Bradyrhizobium sp. USDA 4472]